MILSLGIIIFFGMIIGKIAERLRLPSLVGMILFGILIGPYAYDLLDSKILNISSELRTIALIIILTRAGLSLDIGSLKEIGKPAILMSFLPATFEIIGITILGPLLFDISYLEAGLIGSVLAAVSPAVVVPRMVKLIDQGYGKDKSIPQLVLAGASIDDVYVIVVFTSLLGLLRGKSFNILSFINIPASIILGIILGLVLGRLIGKIFKTIKLDITSKSFILLAITFILYYSELLITLPIKYSALLAIMFLGIGMKETDPIIREQLRPKYDDFWKLFEVLLFVLLGASVNISYIKKAGLLALIWIIGGLLFRVLGVLTSIYKGHFNKKEKIFISVSYLPKATVQAAIGGVALSYGLEVGDLTLTMAVLAILFTAPLGAFLIDNLYKKLLTK